MEIKFHECFKYIKRILITRFSLPVFYVWPQRMTICETFARSFKLLSSLLYFVSERFDMIMIPKYTAPNVSSFRLCLQSRVQLFTNANWDRKTISLPESQTSAGFPNNKTVATSEANFVASPTKHLFKILLQLF